MIGQRGVWAGGTPSVVADLAYIEKVMNRDASPTGATMMDGVEAALDAYDRAFAENGWVRVHVTDPDEGQLYRVATELARMVGGSASLYDGEARKLIAAIGGAS